MKLSLFVLGLFVLLQSVVYLSWFTVDFKFLGWVGIVFVIVLLIEAFWGSFGKRRKG